MSFISVVAKESFISVVSDGLVVDINTGEELEQRYQKFKRISKDQFVAFGGNRELAEKVVELIGYQEEERQLLPIANEIRNQLIKENEPEIESCQVIIGGIENNEIVMYSFNNDENQELLIQKPKGSEINYSFLSNSKNQLNLDTEIAKLNQQYGLNNPTRALKVQERLNDWVANHDKSVNKITFKLVIKK